MDMQKERQTANERLKSPSPLKLRDHSANWCEHAACVGVGVGFNYASAEDKSLRRSAKQTARSYTSVPEALRLTLSPYLSHVVSVNVMVSHAALQTDP